MTGALRANERYAEFCAAAAEDRLDYDGKALEERKALKFQGDKHKKYSHLGSGSILWSVAVKREKQEKERKEKLEQTNGNLNGVSIEDAVSFEGLPEDSMISSFIESHNLMADKFKENYTFLKEVALEKMTALRKELESEVNVMSLMGDATIYELEKAEEDVQKAWSKLWFFSFGPVLESNVSFIHSHCSPLLLYLYE